MQICVDFLLKFYVFLPSLQGAMLSKTISGRGDSWSIAHCPAAAWVPANTPGECQLQRFFSERASGMAWFCTPWSTFLIHSPHTLSWWKWHRTALQSICADPQEKQRQFVLRHLKRGMKEADVPPIQVQKSLLPLCLVARKEIFPLSMWPDKDVVTRVSVSPCLCKDL